ncbi:AAA family ATPase [Aestuariivirga sp.]|uniref:AAA family ATPase n=1 Tax=Aestuariivirga sp. TaxID=2650926 RepID=UPI0039E23825
MSDQRLKVINLWAGPGAGKSTTAAGLFNLMKNMGHSVELVTEVAKDMVYAGRIDELRESQLYVTGKQDHRLRRLIGKTRYVITDSPLPLALVYRPKTGPFADDWFIDTVLQTWRSYENINIQVVRVKKFSPQGRTQKSLEEAKRVDNEVIGLWNRIVPLGGLHVPGDSEAPRTIYDWLVKTKGVHP